MSAGKPSSDTTTGEDWSAWLGRSETCHDLIAAERVAALAATLGLDLAPREDDLLPPGWQWIFFNKMAKRREIGVDGHPRRGGFLPPVTLPRRMWAGSRLAYSPGVVIGAAAERTSVISKIETKTGRGGQLVFITVTHTTRCGGRDCIVEEQDIVYREPPPTNAPAPTLTPAPVGAEQQYEVAPDTVLLFRYSALTYNAHRIHYDLAYARGEEGYPNLVVHGPLTATLLQNFATTCASGRRMTRFEFRGIHPLFLGASFRLEAARGDDGALKVWARGPQGELAMQATALFD